VFVSHTPTRARALAHTHSLSRARRWPSSSHTETRVEPNMLNTLNNCRCVHHHWRRRRGCGCFLQRCCIARVYTHNHTRRAPESERDSLSNAAFFTFVPLFTTCRFRKRRKKRRKRIRDRFSISPSLFLPLSPSLFLSLSFYSLTLVGPKQPELLEEPHYKRARVCASTRLSFRHTRRLFGTVTYYCGSRL